MTIFWATAQTNNHPTKPKPQSNPAKPYNYQLPKPLRSNPAVRTILTPKQTPFPTLHIPKATGILSFLSFQRTAVPRVATLGALVNPQTAAAAEQAPEGPWVKKKAQWNPAFLEKCFLLYRVYHLLINDLIGGEDWNLKKCLLIREGHPKAPLTTSRCIGNRSDPPWPSSLLAILIIAVDL